MKFKVNAAISSVMAFGFFAFVPVQDSSAQIIQAAERSIVGQESSDRPVFASSKLIKKEPVPSWVTLTQLPEYNSARVEQNKGGLAFLLQDTRVQVTRTGHKTFRRFAYKITDRNGLEAASQINHMFDPKVGQLAYNFIRVTRGGQTVDRLPRVDIQEIRPEKGLSSGLIDGNISSLIQLKDIRVGDIIDIGSYSEMQTPLWPGHYFDTLPLSFGVPLTLKRFEITLPERSPLSFKTLNSNLQPTVFRENGRVRYLYESYDADLKPSISDIPEDIITTPTVLLSTMTSWQEVARWGTNVYDIDLRLPQNYDRRVRETAPAHRTPEERMVALLKLVQNDVRYLGLETGVHTHKPRTPSTTLSRGYGDCKDKTMLLIAALKTVGIDAVPALALTKGGHKLKHLLPAIYNFNHVIVRAEVNGKTYWLDPTLSYQGGNAQTLVMPNYGYVLPLRNGQKDLEKIIVPAPQAPNLEVTESYRLTKDKEMFLDVSTVYRAWAADRNRQIIAASGAQATAQKNLAYYSELYPGITIAKKMQVIDDVSANIIRETESYRLSSLDYDLNDLGEKLSIRATALKNNLPTSLEVDRSIPLGLSNNFYRKHTMRIITPSPPTPQPAMNTTLSAPGIFYTEKAHAADGVLTVDHILRVTKSSVPASQARDVVRVTRKINQRLGKAIDLTALQTTAATTSPARTTASQLPHDVQDQINAAITMVRQGNAAEGVRILDTLLRQNPQATRTRGQILLARGSIFLTQQKDMDAIESFEEAFAIHEPDNAQAYLLYSDVLASNADYLEAAIISERLFTRFPEEIIEYNTDYLRAMLAIMRLEDNKSTHDALIMSAAKAQLKHIDAIPIRHRIIDDAIPAMVRMGRLGEVTPLLAHLKDPTKFRDILINKSMKPIWDAVSAKSGKHLTNAISDYVTYTRAIALKPGSGFAEKTDYIDALIKAGRFNDAIRYGERHLDWAKIDAAGHDGFEFVSELSFALFASGQVDAGDALMSDLLRGRLGTQKDVIGQAVTHLGLLSFYGKHEKVLWLMNRYDAAGYFKDYNFDQKFLNIRSCALAATGRKNLADQLYDRQSEDFWNGATSLRFLTAMCLNRQNEAAQIMVQRLNSEPFRAGALPVFSLSNSAKSPNAYNQDLMTRIRTVANRPDVRSVFNRYGRAIYIDGPSAQWREW